MKITFLYSNGATFTARNVIRESLDIFSDDGQKFVNYTQIKNGLVDGAPEKKDGVIVQSTMSTITYKNIVVDAQKSGLQYIFVSDSNNDLGEVLVIPITKDAKVSTEVLADIVSLSL